MNTFLVSFCNNQNHLSKKSNTGLLAKVTLNGDQVNVTNISINLPAGTSIIGATGLASCDEYIYLVAQSKFSQLIVLDKALNFVQLKSLDPLKGVHSIIHQNGYLFMVATKQDKVVKYHLKNSNFEPLFDLQTQTDTHHFNSICLHQNTLLASGFGDNEKEFWMHAENGYVFDVNNNSTVMSNLKQPHSLFSYDNRLFVCDSSRKRVVDQDMNVIDQSKSGYIRGLYIDKNIMLIGRSKGRVISHSQGKYVGNIADKGVLSGECGITITQDQNKKDIDFSGFADEIYDIMPL